MAEIIEMPKLSDTMEVGTLVNWLKKEGDRVEAGDMIAEVETDKATMEVEAFDPGVMLKHYVSEGDQIPIGAPMCAIGEEGESAPEADTSSVKSEGEAAKEFEESAEAEEDDEAPKKSKVQAVEDAPKSEEPKQAEAKPESKGEAQASAKYPSDRANAEQAHTASGADGGRIKVSPLAKKIAADKGLPLEQLTGTGPGGRIVKADVEKALKEGLPAKQAAPQASDAAPSAPSVAPAGAPIQEDKTEKVSSMRATIARRLVESKTTVPHFYLETEVDAAPLGKLRKELNAGLADEGIKLSVNDLLMKAVAEALRRVPAANRSWQGDSIQQYGAVHLAFGVAVEEGLLTPV
ncbi:MAG: dihydrolipoamide acetyltransferase family protein, partial [Verrucomicrobiota bacterium]